MPILATFGDGSQTKLVDDPCCYFLLHYSLQVWLPLDCLPRYIWPSLQGFLQEYPMVFI